MKKNYCIKCDKYGKFENSKISYNFDKALLVSIICVKCGSKDEKISKEQESIEILNILCLINNMNDNIYHAKWIYNYFKTHMAKENLSQEFRLKNIDEKRNYFIEESKPKWFDE